MLSLNKYVQDGIYHIITNVIWMKFVHSCSDGLGRSYFMEHTYAMNPMKLTVEGLLQNSEYNITVEVTNAVGNTAQSVIDMTPPAGEVLNPC